MLKKLVLLLVVGILLPISINIAKLEFIPLRTIKQSGIASYYANKFINRKTANGELYKHNKLTAAHKNLPFNTIVRVTNTGNNKFVYVRINDRLPQNSKRIIDLSKSAADSLNMIKRGLVKVKLDIYI
jgi:rare lipoprotein A